MSQQIRLSALTLIGARAAHQGLSAAFRQPFFDHRASRLPMDTLEKAIHNARYYGWANLLRAAIYVPVLLGLKGSGHWFSIGLIGALVVFHLLCVLAENYKACASRYLLATRQYTIDPEPVSSVDPAKVLVSRYFQPKKIETETFYRRFGFEGIRTLVNLFIEYTQLTADERRQGKKPQQMSPTRMGMLIYQADTRQAERMHLLAGGLNIPPFVSFIMLAKWGYAGWVGFILFIDGALVLLQRYLRVRVASRLARIDAKRAARATP